MMTDYAQGFYRRTTGLNRWDPDTRVAVDHIPGTTLSLLLHDLRYVDADGNTHDALSGLIFDGGSKPIWSWSVIGHPWGDYLPAYAIHDQAYADIRQRITDEGDAYSERDRRRDRKYADKIFREAQIWLKRNLLDKSGSRWERFVIRTKYRVVRIFARRNIA